MTYDPRENIWSDIAGYGGRYQVNPLGAVRRVCKSKVVFLTPYRRKQKGNWVVKLSLDYETKECPVSHLVAAAFLPRPTGNSVLWHKNGALSDNFVGNLEWIDRRTLGKKTSLLADKRRVVAKIDRDGHVIEFYQSARAAARANHMSYQTVLDRCNGKVKKPFELDGHNYVFEHNADEG